MDGYLGRLVKTYLVGYPDRRDIRLIFRIFITLQQDCWFYIRQDAVHLKGRISRVLRPCLVITYRRLARKILVGKCLNQVSNINQGSRK